MRQYFGRQTHRNTFYPLRQHNGELHRQGYRFLFTTVVAGLPAGGLCIKGHIERKFAQTRLDVTRSRRRIAGAHIAPVTLGFDEEVFLTQTHHRIANGCIAVRVILHGLPNDVGHFIKAPIINHLHGMQNTALYRLQAIFNGWHRPLQYYIRGVF